MTKAKNLANKRASIEEWLKTHGVSYHYEGNYPIAKVDFDQSLNNQARLENPLDERRVEIMEEALTNGDTFPALVGYERKGKLIFIDGNHRGAAYKAVGANVIPVYVVTTTDVGTIIEMTHEANARHGMPNSVEERLEHALHMIRTGTNQNIAASTMNVKLGDVKSAWLRSEANRRADVIGVKKLFWNDLSTTSRVRLTALKSDDVMKKAVDVCYRLKLNVNEVNKLVTDINRLTSNTAQIRYLNEFMKEQSPDGVGTAARRRGGRYFITTHSKGLLAQLRRGDLEENLPPLEAQEYVEILTEVQKEIESALKVFRDAAQEES